jgi:tetraacyldisaccharide 4'-kinase
LQSRPIAAFCGIGNPEAFRETLQRLGAAYSDFRIFPDHHRYSRVDVDSLRDWSSRQPSDCLIVTTQKDLVKIRLSVLGGRPLWALRIQMRLESGQDLLERKLMGALSPDPGRSPHAATTAIP